MKNKFYLLIVFSLILMSCSYSYSQNNTNDCASLVEMYINYLEKYDIAPILNYFLAPIDENTVETYKTLFEISEDMRKLKRDVFVLGIKDITEYYKVCLLKVKYRQFTHYFEWEEGVYLEVIKLRYINNIWMIDNVEETEENKLLGKYGTGKIGNKKIYEKILENIDKLSDVDLINKKQYYLSLYTLLMEAQDDPDLKDYVTLRGAFILIDYQTLINELESIDKNGLKKYFKDYEKEKYNLITTPTKKRKIKKYWKNK